MTLQVTLHASRFGSGPRPALALHGITGNGMSWAPIGNALPTEWTLVAVDLRGRGQSRDLPASTGLRDHVRWADPAGRPLDGRVRRGPPRPRPP